MRAIPRLLFALCAVSAWLNGSPGLAQPIDPYRRLTDPRAITYLDGPDREPLRYKWGVGWPPKRDPLDHSFIVAEAEGAGIITHLWFQLQDQPDSLTRFRIWIDDSLVREDFLYSFFRRARGLVRPPFDTVQSGGLVCDLQMPFRKNFRITYSAEFDVCCLFWTVVWRPVADPSKLEPFRLNLSGAAMAQQVQAEKVYWSGDSPWLNTPSKQEDHAWQLAPGQQVSTTIDGPALLHTLRVRPETYDSTLLRDIWLRITWDDMDRPAVDVPLPDFFGAGTAFRNIRSHHIRASEAQGWVSYFPMPFAVRAKIELYSRSQRPLAVDVSLEYSEEPVDRTRQGYFQAQFNERKELPYKVPHSGGYVQGRGRFVGMHLAAPQRTFPSYLEGDPIIIIDSNETNRVGYVGTEDYFNGGWYFSDGAFSLPFAGCTDIHTSYYRMHVLDAIDFNSSFQFILEHGVRNDFRTWYRTVSFFYVQPTPFWSSRDTILPGQSWTIKGNGYKRNTPITIRLDSQLIGSTQADASGSWNKVIALSDIPPGGYTLSVNDVSQAKPVWILARPDVYYLRDTIPVRASWLDSVRITGNGFQPGESVRLFLDTFEVTYTAPVVVDSEHSFNTTILLPWTPEAEFSIVAQGSMGSVAQSFRKLPMTRVVNLEIERMWPPIHSTDQAVQDYMGYFSRSDWSEQYYLLFLPDHAGDYVRVPFSVPYSDTFAVELYATRGVRFGQYNAQVDAFAPTYFDGFEQRDRSDPVRMGPLQLGTMYLEAGVHSLTFECVGKDPNSVEYLLGADNLVLRPTSQFKPQRLEQKEPDSNLSLHEPIDLRIYPNPTLSTLNVVAGQLKDPVRIVGIIDALGRSNPVTMATDGGGVQVSVSDLPAGHYHLKVLILHASGPITMLLPFVKL